MLKSLKDIIAEYIGDYSVGEFRELFNTTTKTAFIRTSELVLEQQLNDLVGGH